MITLNSSRRLSQLLLSLSLIAPMALGASSAGCSGDGPADGFDGIDAAVPPPAPITASATACFSDSECEAGLFCFQDACVFECEADTECSAGHICSDRGRCDLADGQDPSTAGPSGAAEVAAGTGIVNVVPSVIMVAPGQTSVEIVIEASRTVTGGEIGYVINAYDDTSGIDVTDPHLLRAAGEDSFTLEIPTGLADPTAVGSASVRIEVATSIGELAFVLEPQPSAGGAYEGQAWITQLGQAALPMDAQVVVMPEGSSLASASAAWLVLPVRPDAIFSPHAPTAGGPEGVAADLRHDAFTDSWVAIFEHTMELPAGSAFAGHPPGQVVRTLRFELEVYDGNLIGDFSDRFSGILDTRTAEGVVSQADVVFDGEFEMRRTGDAISPTELPTPLALPTPDPQLLPAPPVDACTDAMVAGATWDDGMGTTLDCAAFGTVAAFTGSTDSDAKRNCAIAVGRASLEGDTTISQLTAFIGGTAPPGDIFSDFMADCTMGTGGTCVPAPEVLCARQLAASTYHQQVGPAASAAPALLAFQDVSREAFLGPQLAAYQADAETRLDWLRTQTYPAIVTDAVRGLNESLLDDWRDNVLEAHFRVLAGQYDASGLAMVTRDTADDLSADSRQQLLLTMSQTWRASANGLALAARRWNELYLDAGNREESAAYVRERAFDLYLMSGVLSHVNRDAGAGFASAAFSGGFATIARELRALSLPFSSLIFARDAEVVVSTSLDPTRGGDTVLGERRDAAFAELEAAATAVTSTLSDLEGDMVDEATLRMRLSQQVQELRGELVELCGLPFGCSVADVGTPECRPRVLPGKCGFGIDQEGQITALLGPAISEASLAVTGIWEAENEARLAAADESAHLNRVLRHAQLTAGFAQQVERWNERRMETDEAVSILVDEAQDRRRDALVDLRRFLEDGTQIRVRAAAERELWVANWDAIEGDVRTDLRSLIDARRHEVRSSSLGIVGDVLESSANAFFGVSGADSADAFSVATAIAGTTVQVGAIAFNVASDIEGILADDINSLVNRNDIQRQSDIARMEFDIDFQTAAREDRLAELEGEMEALATSSDFQDAILQAIIEDLEGQLADELAYERDLIEVNDRAAALADMVGETDGLSIRRAQARLTLLQKQIAYAQVIQRAQLLDARLRSLEEESQHIETLLGSPSVVFGWANRLAQAENRLDRSKDAMIEWLVALEFLAVRPFMDQRVQILLARNTYQLEEIADELDRLQRSCGGALNTENVSLSLRSDLLELDRGIVDAATGETLTVADRFRQTLDAAPVPVDKRIRYSADSTIGDLVRSRSVMAATFDISIDEFANLATSCNAKISSVQIELVGEGLGSANPVVSLLYDGASVVRSCQPGIDGIVESIGRAATSFGSVTTFRAAGRSVSPIAGINEPGGVNMTLQGLPLASEYTVLIDPLVGENRDIEWQNLDDIIIHLEYVYQDVFPMGQCE